MSGLQIDDAVKRRYHTDGTLPERGEFFVFGSNTSGYHGKGAAEVALNMFGAIPGMGRGIMGRSYAIPTKGSTVSSEGKRRLYPLSIREVQENIKEFCEFTKSHLNMRFWVTAVGCGYAGNHPRDIAPMFKQAINCSFPVEWMDYLERGYEQ